MIIFMYHRNIKGMANEILETSNELAEQISTDEVPGLYYKLHGISLVYTVLKFGSITWL